MEEDLFAPKQIEKYSWIFQLLAKESKVNLYLIYPGTTKHLTAALMPNASFWKKPECSFFVLTKALVQLVTTLELPK